MSNIKDNTSGLLAILEAVNDLPTADDTEYEIYDGSYQVTPKTASQTLATANKLMQADVMVNEIPYAEVTNNSGGKTASIG